MSGEKNLEELLKNLEPKLNNGEYVYTKVSDFSKINSEDILMLFKEKEAITLILKREIADKLNLSYEYICSWITLAIHSSLEAVGLTAAFSKALGEANISCNVVAGYYHDHIFVDIKDSNRAMNVLKNLSK